MAGTTSLAVSVSLQLQPKKKKLSEAISGFSPSTTTATCYSTYPISCSASNDNNKKKNQISFALSSSTDPSSPSPPSSSSESEKPQIELEFVAPKQGVDGSYQRHRASADSGEKLLRNIMLDNKIELYAAYGKVMNCGGGGSCGTCIVEIIEGEDLLNERTDTEKRYMKKKPESWRLACQTIVGNKENSGKVIVQRLPQWKK